MIDPWTFGGAKRIRGTERDRELAIDAETWPQPDHQPKRWEKGDGYMSRVIRAQANVTPVELEEWVLRFPSAPLHSLQRMHEHHVLLGPSENFHTYRVLRSADPSLRENPVKRIFLMHTGLNERDSMGLYYRLASNLIEEVPETVCIVRPFPGHLTRFPFQGFAETPLDRYLWDGSHLFRQFVRHMVETQWFLSVLARRSSYLYASGANLLAESADPATSRLNTSYLAEAMFNAWMQIHEQSEAALVKPLQEQPRAPHVSDAPTLPLFESAIGSLRALLDLDDDSTKHAEGAEDRESADPALHVIGYSLGGFTAQSVFMSWPFLIASCSTLLGGGALRELAPSAFAHPEEWQTVLHSLRYELDDLMMGAQIESDPNSVAGIDLELFTYFKRTFYEVFQQDYRGSFRTRLAAFRKRMLFVVGGNDPIVRPESVLDSAPPGGLNLLEIGGLSHFLDGPSEGREEDQQRSFWVPEMAALLSHFADGVMDAQTRERSFTSFDADMNKPTTPRKVFEDELLHDKATMRASEDPVRRLAATELLAIGPDGALPGTSFERCLDDLLARTRSTDPEHDGVLFILRNEVPTILVHDAVVRERAAALYHEDVGIVQYCHGVETRRTIVKDNIPRICVILPWNARQIVEKMDVHRGYPSQAESSGGHVPKRVSNQEAWEECLKECRSLTQGEGRDSIRMFNGNKLLSPDEGSVPEPLRKVAEGFAGREPLTRVASLPDCWLWVSRSVLGVPSNAPMTIEPAIKELCRVVPYLCQSDNDKSEHGWEQALLKELQSDRIRIVTVSRARYNPRYRGRLIVTPKSARSLLVHVALCLALSESTASRNLSTVFS